MKKIPLIHGEFALIDDEDYEVVSKYTWRALNCDNKIYAEAHTKVQQRNVHILMHRLVTKCPKGMCIDHIDLNTLDNRKNNLRICTQRQNMQNMVKRSGTSSKYKGVTLLKKCSKWKTSIKANGKTINGGSFLNEIDAAKKYDELAQKHFGEFARLNFSKGGYENGNN